MKTILLLLALTLTIVCAKAQYFGWVPGGGCYNQSYNPSGLGWGYGNNVNVNVVTPYGGVSVSAPAVTRRQRGHWENRTYTQSVVVYDMAAPGVYLLYNGQYVTHSEQRTYTQREWVCY